MKKILSLLLVLLSVTSICFAELKKPNEERWGPISLSENMKTWIDKETLKYVKEDDVRYNCRQHRMVYYWLLSHNDKNKEVPIAKMYTRLDLDCRTIKTIYTILYDKNNKEVYSKDSSHEPPAPVIPETSGEALIDAFTNSWEKTYLE